MWVQTMNKSKLLRRRHLEGRWGDYPYHLFISYSHEDMEHVEAFERRLKRYEVPAWMQKAWTPFGPPPKRLKPHFRDKRSLAANHDIGDELQKALAGSASLVVFCSPNAVKSHFVDEEIQRFRASHKDEWNKYKEGERIFPIIVGGDPSSSDAEQQCFPPELTKVFSEAGEVIDGKTKVPFAADARPVPIGDGEEQAFYKVVAGLLGMDASIVSREDLKRERLERGVRWSAITLAMAVILSLTGFTRQFMMQEQARWTAESTYIADRAQSVFAESGGAREQEALATALVGWNYARGALLDASPLFTSFELNEDVSDTLQLILSSNTNPEYATIGVIQYDTVDDDDERSSTGHGRFATIKLAEQVLVIHLPDEMAISRNRSVSDN